MLCVRRSAGSTACLRVTAATTSSCRFATRFFESIVEHGFGVLDCPLVREHLIETWIVVVQAQQQLAQVSPRFNTMTLGAGEDREQDGRIAKETGISESALAQFYNGHRGLSMEALNALGEFLQLTIILGRKPRERKVKDGQHFKRSGRQATDIILRSQRRPEVDSAG